MNLTKQIEDLVKPVIEKAGYECKRIELKRKGRAKELIITINKEGGIDIEDCVKVSKLVDQILEKEDLIKSKYFLTVSSPGLK